jgi:hypothetical protein
VLRRADTPRDLGLEIGGVNGARRGVALPLIPSVHKIGSRKDAAHPLDIRASDCPDFPGASQYRNTLYIQAFVRSDESIEADRLQVFYRLKETVPSSSRCTVARSVIHLFRTTR